MRFLSRIVRCSKGQCRRSGARFLKHHGFSWPQKTEIADNREKAIAEKGAWCPGAELPIIIFYLI
jgi:rhodanese-related sulfurtransferase